MKKGDKKASHRVMQSAEKSGVQGDDAMSPPMRELILSFVDTDSKRTWDADAYTRRSSLTAA